VHAASTGSATELALQQPSTTRSVVIDDYAQ
jgi:hypothetical protein